MSYISKHIRGVVYLLSSLWGVVFFIYVLGMFGGSTLFYIRLTQGYALTAGVLLYFTIFISPFYGTFPDFPLKTPALRAKKALGISAFFFGLLHALTALFKLLGGFGGLSFLSIQFLTAVIISFGALLILSILALTSFTFFKVKMGSWWKWLHRFVYLAAVLLLIHAFMIGTHFIDISRKIPQITLVALLILAVLEAVRFDKNYQQRFPQSPRVGIVFISSLLVISFFSFYVFLPQNLFSSFNIHAGHTGSAGENIPNSIAFTPPGTITPGTLTILHFTSDSTDGRVVDEPPHLIIVDDQFSFFEHIHPEMGVKENKQEYVARVEFPKAGLYHLYLDFHPEVEEGKTFIYTITVGP